MFVANYFLQYFFMLDLWLSLRKSDKTMIWQENLHTVQVHLKLRNLHGLSNSKIKISKIKEINKNKDLRLTWFSAPRQSSILYLLA